MISGAILQVFNLIKVFLEICMEMFYPRIYIVNVYPMNARTLINADFLDILFDGRNKDYGAYELRRSEDRRVRNAIIGTASVALVIIGGYVLSNKLMAADMAKRSEVIVHPTIPEMREVTEEKTVTPPPPSLPTPPPPAVSTAAFVTPTITDDNLAADETEVPPRDSLAAKAIGFSNTNVDGGADIDNPFAGAVPGGNGVVEPPAPTVIHSDPPSWVEIMPAFPGGDEALARFLQKNIRYPHMAQENGVEGKIFVQFIVNKEGKISDVQTVGAHKGAGLEEEAMRVVKMMPNWKPGKQNGEQVAVRFNLPIGFLLQQ